MHANRKDPPHVLDAERAERAAAWSFGYGSGPDTTLPDTPVWGEEPPLDPAQQRLDYDPYRRPLA